MLHLQGFYDSLYQLCDFAFGKWKFDALSWSQVHFELSVVSAVMSESRAETKTLVLFGAKICAIIILLQYVGFEQKFLNT